MNAKTGRRVIVLDTSALIMNYNPLSISEVHYTVPGVLNELVPKTTAWLRFKVAAETGKIKLRTPSPKSLMKIDDLSAKIGDFRYLSVVDKRVLALSLELREEGVHPIIVTDDYSIQNVADQLELEYASLTTFGIRYRFHWILYCPACHRKYPQTWPSETCGVCGTKLRRRVLRKVPAKKKRET